MNTIEALYDAVQKRPRPEDVAELVLEALGDRLSLSERRILEGAARGSLKRAAHAYSSMAADFVRPVSAEKQVGTASKVFGVEPLTAAACMSPDRVEDFLKVIGAQISWTIGEAGKLNKEQRHAQGIFKCQRWYNKRLRIVRHLEDKAKRLAWNNRKYLFTRVGKSALAVKIPSDAFQADLNTACLVAYLSAKMSVRSVFTNQSQARAYDNVAEMLLTRCERSSTTARWDVIAHVMADERVLRRLDEEGKGRLLGAWWELLVDMADMLHEVQRTTNFNRTDMVVQRGNDSSTWNQVAGGWNQARANWISLLHAMGCESLLNEVCPGKVMRLMAADVAYWHRASGGDIHPDTKVWADLPAPWDVLRGVQVCNRELVEMACAHHNVDPENWTGQKKDRRAVPFNPTPELVHGVAVSSPLLATALRKAGVFSGQGLKAPVPAVEIDRDENGFAVQARPIGVSDLSASTPQG